MYIHKKARFYTVKFFTIDNFDYFLNNFVIKIHLTPLLF